MLPAINSPSLAYGLAVATYVLNWFEDSMSEIVDGLWVGNIAAAWDHRTLRAKRIDAIVSLTQFGEAATFYPSEFSYYIIGIQDVPESDIESVLARTAAFIDVHLQAGKRVLVHCNRGKSRSATAAAAYLIAHRGMCPTGALDLLRKQRDIVCPNPGFIRQLYTFAESLKAARSATSASSCDSADREATQPHVIFSESDKGGPPDSK
jgi:atypical dual specificity phosphatase